MPLLATKLYIPPPGPQAVGRPRLIERLNEGLGRKLTLLSAPAGFGKTTLASEWVAGCGRPVAWLSLDEGDSDPARFLTYLIAALQTVAAEIGAGVLGTLQSPQPPPPETILTALLNDIAAVPGRFVLVLDDYHVVDSQVVDQAVTFLLDHLPPQLHLVIATREDPQVPLARLRARSQLSELRVGDVRFTLAEAAAFLTRAMGLSLAADDIAALEARTEGWVAGLQLAALSLRGHHDAAGFIRSFSGNHRFVLDYLLEEVLHRQPAPIQDFLLRTAILERMCGPLCDAVLDDPAAAGQTTLEYLEHANLFIIALDNERRWYRYHHLFADLLRQRLQRSGAAGEDGRGVAELHMRASRWYEANGLELEAFQHATAANDVANAERLIEGKGMPLHFRGAVAPVLSWLKSLPTAVLDARPSLWLIYASVALATGQTTVTEQKLQAAEAALLHKDPAALDARERDLLGRVAATRATLALAQNQVDALVAQSRRALEYLHPANLPFRTSTLWKLGYAYHVQGERDAARRAYEEVIATGEASGNIVFTLLGRASLGDIQEQATLLPLAAETYRGILSQIADVPLPAASCQSHLGMARIHYEWNDLEAAQQHIQQSIERARQIENTDRGLACTVVLAYLKLAQGDPAGAAVLAAQAGQTARQHNFTAQIPPAAAAQVRALLRMGDLAAAARLAHEHDLPVSQARVRLAQGDPAAALALLRPVLQQAEDRGWQDERLVALVLQALALQAQGDPAAATSRLGEALALAEPGGHIRTFIDEGGPMTQLLAAAAAHGVMPDYCARLLAAWDAERPAGPAAADAPPAPPAQPLIEPLSQRELAVLRLIAQGLSNHDISARLFLSLNTVKGHNQKIFAKLQVQRRTEAVARARELGLL